MRQLRIIISAILVFCLVVCAANLIEAAAAESAAKIAYHLKNFAVGAFGAFFAAVVIVELDIDKNKK